MAQELASLVVSLEANIAKFQSDMGRAAYLTQKALADMQRAAEKLDERIGDLGRNIVGFAAVYVSVDQLASSFRNALNEMDQMVKMSQKFGVATDSLQELAHAGKLSDVEVDKLGLSMKALSVNLAEAVGGSKSQIAAFKALGIEYQNADGSARAVADVINDVADKFAGAEDGAEKAAWAVALFGKSGQDMIPMLNGGSAGLKALADEARRFGLVVENDVLVAAEKFNDNMTRMTSMIRGQMNVAVAALLPNLNDLTESFIEISNAQDNVFTASEMSDWTDDLSVGIARVIDVLSLVPKLILGVGTAIRAVIKDVQFLNEIMSAVSAESVISNRILGKPLIGPEVYAKAEERNKAADFNAKVWEDILTNPGNRMEQAMLERIARRKLTSPFPLQDLPDSPAMKNGELPPPPQSGSGLETAADKERRRLLKAIVDGRVVDLEAGLAKERDAFAAHDQLLAALRQQELISAQVFEDARAATREAMLAATVRTYDAEITELQKLKTAKGIEQSEITDIDNKIAAIAARREKAANDAAAAAQQQAISRGAVQASLNVQMREYAAELDRTNDALVFQATLTARNAADVARLVAEYRILAQVEEDIRRAKLASPDEVDELGMRIEGLRRAKAAGQAAEFAANETAVRSLAFQMNEYAMAVQRATEFENTRLDLTGKTAQEAEKALNARRIQLDTEEQIRRAQLQSSAPIDRQPFDERSKKLIEDSNATTDRRYRQLRDPWLGAKAAVVAYGEEASKVGEQIGNVFTTAFRGMEDAFVNFVTTGKLSFRDLADAIIIEMVRIQARQAAANLGNWLFNVGASMFGPMKATPQAAGGVWSGGVQKFATGGIVSSPTMFGTAGGMGLMGEAGPEAILPLKRGAGGRLGVIAQVGQSSPAVNVSNIYHIDARSDRSQIIQMIEEGSRRTQATIQSQIARGSTAYSRPA